jgi:hypothetical protein
VSGEHLQAQFSTADGARHQVRMVHGGTIPVRCAESGHPGLAVECRCE